MNRLKEARKARGLTQVQVARHMGIGQSGYSDWERGNVKLDSGSLARVAELFDCSVDWLLGRDALPENTRPYTRGVRIPVLGTVVAGIPLEAVQDIVDYEEIDGKLAATGEFFALLVRGSSMEPRFVEGDTVIVRRQPDVESGEIAIVFVNGDEATMKKVLKQPNGITLIAFNPAAYEPHYYSNEQIAELPITIYGKVVELRGKF